MFGKVLPVAESTGSTREGRRLGNVSNNDLEISVMKEERRLCQWEERWEQKSEDPRTVGDERSVNNF
jgi:hypothetical protein